MGANGRSWSRRRAAWRWKDDQAIKARRHADALECEAFNERMMQLGGPIQPSPTLYGDERWLCVAPRPLQRVPANGLGRPHQDSAPARHADLEAGSVAGVSGLSPWPQLRATRQDRNALPV